SYIGRRKFLATLGGTAAWPLAARAQQSERMRRIGVLTDQAENDPEGQARIAAFLQGLAQLGWIDGRNVRIDTRWPTSMQEVRKYSAELVGLAPDVLPRNRQRKPSRFSGSDQDRGYRVRERRGPGRWRLCRELGAARRQRYRI